MTELRAGAALRSADELIAAGLVPDSRRAELETLAESFAIGVSAAMTRLIDREDPNDPIAKQFIPDSRELLTNPQELSDPIGDQAFSPVEGIVHRYPDRVLLKLLHICPVYCRFCFRRETIGPHSAMHLSDAAFDRAFAYIGARPEIWEVILTGGDPLMLSSRRLKAITERLKRIDHVKILRLHSRVPVVDPDRITPALVDLLKSSGKTVFLVLHANHPRELTPEAKVACAKFVDGGISMLSQSVLLKGVNDSVETLGGLMRGFVELGIKPYYLHQLDLARGTSHFRVPIEEGQSLMRALRGSLSGLCQPNYVLDLPGGHGKSPIGPNYLTPSVTTNSYCVEDYQGGQHIYRADKP
jgi:lysine 2,3-aminomutase